MLFKLICTVHVGIQYITPLNNLSAKHIMLTYWPLQVLHVKFWMLHFPNNPNLKGHWQFGVLIPEKWQRKVLTAFLLQYSIQYSGDFVLLHGEDLINRKRTQRNSFLQWQVMILYKWVSIAFAFDAETCTTVKLNWELITCFRQMLTLQDFFYCLHLFTQWCCPLGERQTFWFCKL